MSNFNIKNEKQLNMFLKLVAEEAYKKSRDPYARQYQELRRKDMDVYTLEEVDEDQPFEPLEDEGDAAAEAEGDLLPPEDDEGAAADAPDDTKAESEPVEKVSFGAIKKAINNLRAGHSLKDDEVEGSLNVYYERLDENERQVLYTFLDELSKILNRSVSGNDAQDPGDPPVSIDFVTGDEKADEKAAADVEEPKAEAEPEGEGEEEDTSPPIAVNENQRKEDLRRKIRVLMAR